MILSHNESVFKALEAIKNEIESIDHLLDVAIDELIYASNTGNEENKEHYIKNAIRFIEESRGKLHNN